MARIINLFGGPGVGKSTTAAQVFAIMKREGEEVELVTEHAKDLVWDNARMDNQIAILGEQDKRLFRLIGKVKYVITDSPLLLGALYAGGRHADPMFTNFLLWAFRTYDNQNFLLTRYEGQKFSEVGRNQTLSEAQKLDAKCSEFFRRFGVGFTEVTVGPHTPQFIYEQIKARAYWDTQPAWKSEVVNGTP